MNIPPTVVAVSNPNTYRVAFSLAEEDNRWTQVVCYAYVKDGKIEMAYSHHIHYARTSTVGPWTEYSTVQLPMTPILESLIRSNVMLALMNEFAGKVVSVPEEKHEGLAKLFERAIFGTLRTELDS